MQALSAHYSRQQLQQTRSGCSHAPTVLELVPARRVVPSSPASPTPAAFPSPVGSSCSCKWRTRPTSIFTLEQLQVVCHSQSNGQDQPTADEYCVVNFYHLVEVPNPKQLVEEHRAWIAAQGLDVRGRIYYSEQGVNAQYGGTRHDALAYLDWLKSQPLWKDIRYTVWPSAVGHAYPKLRLKYKPNLISMASGVQNFPVTDPAARATPLEPSDWKKMLAEAEVLQHADAAAAIQQAQEKKIVVVDLRNDYEWDAGHFQGAERPKEQVFNETPVGDGDADVPEYLRNLSPDSPVMMYCTGGIRCDIYSAFLRRKGFNNLYTLEGGIQNYLRTEGPDLWNGSLYVFDGRMAIAGDQRDPVAALNAPLKAAVPCQLCGSADAELPHVNCANIDCNALFIGCPGCKARLQGCCCEQCMAAPRLLRPAKVNGGQYGAWGNYADGERVGPIMASGRSEGRLTRRARHREVLKEKHAKQVAEKLAKKAMLREAMACFEEAEQHRTEAEGAQEEQRDISELLRNKQQAVAV